MIRKILQRLRKSDHGASFIEFALVLPFLLALVIGIVEFGWIFNGYINITGAAREGARLAARGEEISLINERIKAHASVFPEGSISDALIPGYPDSIAPGAEIEVTVSGDLPLLINFIGGENSIIPFPNIGNDGEITLSGEATMRREY